MKTFLSNNPYNDHLDERDALLDEKQDHELVEVELVQIDDPERGDSGPLEHARAGDHDDDRADLEHDDADPLGLGLGGVRGHSYEDDDVRGVWHSQYGELVDDRDVDGDLEDEHGSLSDAGSDEDSIGGAR